MYQTSFLFLYSNLFSHRELCSVICKIFLRNHVFFLLWLFAPCLDLYNLLTRLIGQLSRWYKFLKLPLLVFKNILKFLSVKDCSCLFVWSKIHLLLGFYFSGSVFFTYSKKHSTSTVFLLWPKWKIVCSSV